MSPLFAADLKARFRCAMKGHDRQWSAGSIMAGWECVRCGRRGRLDQASSLPLGEHLVHFAASIMVVVIIVVILKLIF